MFDLNFFYSNSYFLNATFIIIIIIFQNLEINVCDIEVFLHFHISFNFVNHFFLSAVVGLC